jgi:glycosyltransferase involved in cell wall biosynthesis
LSTPLVSVLIPCYNSARFIGETLESVFRQSWPEIEVIVVNDGSTDGSVSEIRRFARDRLLLIDRANRGACASRNAAFARAKGAFIQFLDADDLLSREKIASQMRRLSHHPDCVAAAEWSRFHSGPEEASFEPLPTWRDLDPLDWIALSRADGLGMMFPALWLTPRRIAEAAGPWLEELTVGDDTEYFTRLVLCARRVLFCQGARAYYRSGIAGSLSGRTSTTAYASELRAVELCERQVLSREDSERMRRAFALSWQHLAHAAYPYDRGLASRALIHARSLHGVSIRPTGGPAFRLLSRLLGWRTARLLQVASGRP